MPTTLCHALEPLLLPGGPSFVFPLALPANTCGAAQVKSSSNTQVMQRTRRVRKQRGGTPTKDFARSLPPPDVAPLGQYAGSTSLNSARSRTWPCACVLREKASPPQLAIRSPASPAHRGTSAPCEPKFHHLGVRRPHHRHYKNVASIR